MSTPDYKLQRTDLYRPSSRDMTIVDVPPMPFLMIDGTGDPTTSAEYKEALQALYGLAFTLKLLLKREQGLDYTMAPLEGLWWTPDMREFNPENKERWQWTMMIRQPEEVTSALVERAREEAQRKRPSAALERVRLESFAEGLAAQILYLGPYSMEGPTIIRLHAFIREQGGSFDGRRQKHHEIYLSNPRRTAPEKLKTIVRQPFLRPTI
jgi:hypothetical protein